MDFELKHKNRSHRVQLYLTKSFKEIGEFRAKISQSPTLLYCPLNPANLVSIKALMLAIQRIESKLGQADMFEFQKTLSLILSPEHFKDHRRFLQENVIKSPTLHVFVDLTQELATQVEDIIQRQAEQDELNNLANYCSIQGIIEVNNEDYRQLYQINDKELSLDQDVRGSVYNHIALRKLNK